MRNPAFEAADIERVRGQWLSGIAQEKTQPNSLALRALPPLLFGDKHPYGIPLTGSGTEAAIKSLNAQDLRQFHSQWLRPDNLRILVAGDTTLAQIIPQLDAVFGDWKAPTAALPKKNLANVAAQPKPRVYLINRPDAPQSVILAGLLAPSTKAPDNLAIGVANERLRRHLHLALEHESAREQALGLWRRHPHDGCTRPAAIPVLGTGADRQDRRIGQ